MVSSHPRRVLLHPTWPSEMKSIFVFSGFRLPRTSGLEAGLAAYGIWERKKIWATGLFMGNLSGREKYTKNELRLGWCSRIYYKTWALSGGIMERIPWCECFMVFSRRLEKRRTSDFHSHALRFNEDYAKKSIGGVGKDGLIRVSAFIFPNSATAFACSLSPPGETNLLQLAFSCIRRS